MDDDRWLVTQFLSWLISGLGSGDPEEALRAQRLRLALSGYCSPNRGFDNAEGMTPLMHICKYGAAENFTKFFRVHQRSFHVRSINAVNDNGDTPLLIAIKRGSLYFVRSLVSKGADINQRNLRTNVSPVMLACCLGEIRIFSYLVGQGAVLHDRDRENKGILEYAVKAKNQTFLEEILIKYPKIYEHEPDDRYKTFIFHIIRSQHISSMRRMLSVREAWPRDLISPEGHSLLMHAVACQAEPIVSLLIESERNINYTNQAGESALTLAIQRPSIRICGSLLALHPLLNIIHEKSGNSILMLSLLYDKPLIVSTVITEDYGLDYYQHQNLIGETALHLAVEKGNKDCIDYLLNKCPFLAGIADNKQQYPWMLAWKKNDHELLRYLFEQYPANLSLRGPAGDTPLLAAARHRDLNFFKMLVELGADWKDKTAANETVLILALKTKAFDIVNFIIKAGEIDWGASDCNQITAMDLATQQQSPLLIAFLVAKNCSPSSEGKEIIIKLVDALLFSNDGSGHEKELFEKGEKHSAPLIEKEQSTTKCGT